MSPSDVWLPRRSAGKQGWSFLTGVKTWNCWYLSVPLWYVIGLFLCCQYHFLREMCIFITQSSTLGVCVCWRHKNNPTWNCISVVRWPGNWPHYSSVVTTAFRPALGTRPPSQGFPWPGEEDSLLLSNAEIRNAQLELHSYIYHYTMLNC
jgi:hypothetical protein